MIFFIIVAQFAQPCPPPGGGVVSCKTPNADQHRGAYVQAIEPSKYLERHCKLIRRGSNLYWCQSPETKR